MTIHQYFKDSHERSSVYVMAKLVVQFSIEGYKIRKVFGYIEINYSQMKLPNFDNWSNGELSKVGHHFRKYSDSKIDVIKICQ